MRVISGLYKGRRVKALRGLMMRPTADRVRESMFNIMGQHLDGTNFLDLFAGSGAVGIEALSRGAQFCVFVDSSAQACRIIRQNLQALDISDSAEIHCRDVLGAVEIAARKGRKFDSVFIDPPYDSGLALATLKKVDFWPILADSGVCIVEHSLKEPLPENLKTIALRRRQNYGETSLSFYERSRD